MRLNHEKVVTVLEKYPDNWFTKEELMGLVQIDHSQMNKILREMRRDRRLLYRDIGQKSTITYIYTYRLGCREDKRCNVI